MKVYVVNIDNQPLMPCSPRKARILLKNKKATVMSVYPFTIKLSYEVDNHTQPITLGVDSGYLNVGLSAISKKEELYSANVSLLKNMKDRLIKKAMYRRNRRQRLRYRKPRFDNRKGFTSTDKLAPSIQHKLDSHLKIIEKLYKILPITNIIIEVANFDIQKINNPDIEGAEYQQGEQLGFYNLREYILHRDNHTCQNPDCKNKSTNKILELHHIIFRSNSGTDKPSNLITLCTKCHTSTNHKKGKLLDLWQYDKPKVKSFRPETFMSIVRWKLFNKLKELYTDVELTYGYLTKNKRIKLKLSKTHANDAFCIANGNDQIKLNLFEVNQVKRNNRSLEKFYDAKYIDIRTGEKVNAETLDCGRKRRDKSSIHNSENLRIYRGEKLKKGFRSIRRKRYIYQPNDLIRVDNKIYKVSGCISYGQYINTKCKLRFNTNTVETYRFNYGFVYG